MATNMQSFIDQMKQRQMAMSSDDKGPRSLFVMPMRARFMGNTGTGENESVEANRPVAMLATARGPRMLHEGEDMYQDGSRITVVPAKQSSLRNMERRNNIPGYKDGGDFYIAGDPDAPASPENTWIPETPDPYKPKLDLNYESVDPDAPAKDLPEDPSTLTFSAPTVKAAAGRTGTEHTFNFGPQSTITGAVPSTVTKPAPITGTMPTIRGREGTTVAFNPAMATTATTPGTTATTTAGGPTALTYGRQGMQALSDIAAGGSPALKAIQDKYLQDLKATQGVSERVAGFEAAQGNVGKEVAAARMAMGRAVAGSQLGQAESNMAAEEMKQREQANRDLVSQSSVLQNMETNQATNIADMVNRGFSKEQINATTGANLSDADYAKLNSSSSKALTQAAAMVTAGDFEGANKVFTDAGLPTINFGKVEAGELNTIVDQIDKNIADLGPDADPNVIAGLYTLKTKIRGQQWAKYGIDPTAMSITNADGTKTSIADLVKTVENPTTATPKDAETVARLTGGAFDFYDTPEGDIELEALSSSPEWTTLSDKAENGDETSISEMGKVLGAVWVQSNYVSTPNSPKPNDAQVALLKKYGVYREPVATQAEVQPKINNIDSILSSGDIAGAKQAYDNLSDSEKKLAGSWESISKTAMERLVNDIVAKKSYDAYLVGKPTSDPIYKAILDKTAPLSLSYNDNAWRNDTITGAPAAGTWVKYQTPDGVKMLKVTYNGHLNTGGTSDRAYLEFQDSEGNMYSTGGASTTLVKGTNTKYKRK